VPHGTQVNIHENRVKIKEGKVYQGVRENVIIWSFMIVTPYLISCG
jgi:hypothetical protein